jgi:hypothetical protein
MENKKIIFLHYISEVIFTLSVYINQQLIFLLVYNGCSNLKFIKLAMTF